MRNVLGLIREQFAKVFSAEARVKRDPKLRERFFKDMDILLRNGAGVQELLGKMLGPASNYGKRPMAPKAVMIRDLQSRPHEDIGTAISRWTPPMEGMLVSIGFRTGRLSDTFDAIRLLMNKRSEVQKYLTTLPMPFVTFGSAMYMLVAINSDFTPALASLQPIPAWPLVTRLLVYWAALANAVWLPMLILTAIAIVAVPASFPRLRGELRYRLDKLWPWNMYKNITGAFFLYSMALLISRGIGERDALLQIRKMANPYLRERIDGFLRSVSNGRDLGRAMREAGYEYPDREAIGFVELLGQQQGFAAALLDYATEYLTVSTDRLKAQLAALGAACMVFAFTVAGLNALSSLVMQQAIRALSH